MNLRTLIVNGLYPLCSEEVQILIDQMKEHPEKFEDLFESMPYRIENPWFRALQLGNFELIDHVALHQQLKLLKTKYSKQLILEGLMETKEREHNRDANLDMFSSLKSTAPNTTLTTKAMQQATQHILKAQLKAQLKHQVDAQFKKDYAKYKAKNRYAK
jgi:hypothetical protein